MKKNTRIKHRKYNSRKKFVFPLIGLSILLVMSVVGAFATAGDTFTDVNTGLKFKILTEETDSTNNTVTSGTVAIVGYDESVNDDLFKEGTLTIPSEVEYDSNDNSANTSNVTYKITDIGDYDSANDSPFKKCEQIISIDFSNATNLERIGQAAFQGCTNLTSIDLNGATNLTNIGQYAFEGCTSLVSADLTDATILGTIAHHAFENCDALESIKLPASIRVIGESAFKNCTSLISVIAEKTSDLTSIRTEAFANCPWLTEFPDLKDSSVSITNGAFWGCCYLDSDLLPEVEDANPFGTAFSLKAVLRGTSITKIHPTDGYNIDSKEQEDIIIREDADGDGEEERAPLRFFADQTYRVYFDPETTDHSIVGLDLADNDDIDKMTVPYSISNEFSPQTAAEKEYDFTIPSNWAVNPVYLQAIATEDGETSGGALSITTESLENGVIGKSYEYQLEASPNTNVKWSVGEPGLPDGFNLSENGLLTCDNIKAAAGIHTIGFVANNGVTTDKRKLTLKIYDNKLDDFESNSLWWDENGNKVTVNWNPLVTGNEESVDYTIQLYDEANNKVGDAIKRSLAGTSTFTSEFNSIDVTSILESNGKGTYHFTVAAKSASYGSSYASSDDSRYAKGSGLYYYGYAEYTITATATGSGTGKISVSNDSYNIPGIEVDPISNGIEVTVLETSITNKRPLTFNFTPDKGCEVTSLTVNGVAVRKNMEQYVISSMDDIPAAAADNSGSSSSGSTSSSDSSSGVLSSRAASSTLNADATNTTLNAYSSEDLDIIVEFGLVSNNIDGNIIADGTYVQGEQASFQAIGDGMSDVPMVDGVTRWIPKYWWLDEEEKTETTTTHTWTGEPYTDAIDTTNLSLGTHTLYVAFQKQNYVGSTGQWVDATTANSLDVKAADFVVTDRLGNTEDPDADSDGDGTGTDIDGSTTTDSETPVKSDKDKNGGSKGSSSGSGVGSVVDRVTSTISNVATGDDMAMFLWIGLALVSLIGMGFCVRQIIKH